MMKFTLAASVFALATSLSVYVLWNTITGKDISIVLVLSITFLIVIALLGALNQGPALSALVRAAAKYLNKK